MGCFSSLRDRGQRRFQAAGAAKLELDASRALSNTASKAPGEVLIILGADLTVPPEPIPRFYEAIRSGQGEFINGSRLVYPMEQQAMRFLNLVGNRVF